MRPLPRRRVRGALPEEHVIYYCDRSPARKRPRDEPGSFCHPETISDIPRRQPDFRSTNGDHDDWQFRYQFRFVRIANYFCILYTWTCLLRIRFRTIMLAPKFPLLYIPKLLSLYFLHHNILRQSDKTFASTYKTVTINLWCHD